MINDLGLLDTFHYKYVFLKKVLNVYTHLSTERSQWKENLNQHEHNHQRISKWYD